MAGSNDPSARRRGPGRPFQKGQSGNPGGKSKAIEDLRAAARGHAADALATLVELLEHRDGKVRLGSAIALLDRGYGRPVLAISGPDGGPIAVAQVNVDDVRAKLTRLADSAPGPGEPDRR